MNVGDVVSISDAKGEHTGVVAKLLPEAGMVKVLWNSGVTEDVHESELKKIGIATQVADLEGIEIKDGRVVDGHQRLYAMLATAQDVEDDDPYEPEDPYEPDNPKHPSFRERLAALWDSRPGK